MMRYLLFAALLAAAPVAAQAPLANFEAANRDDTRRASAVDALSFRPDANGIAATEALLAATADAPVKARADALRAAAAAANAAGRTGDTLRLLSEAVARLRGEDWAATGYPASLKLSLGTVADAATPLLVTLDQRWTVAAPRGSGEVVATLSAPGVPSREIKRATVANAKPRLAIPLTGIAPGHYRLDVAVAGTTLSSPLDVVAGLDAARAEVERRVAKIAGHAAAKATIRYPFTLARDINRTEREVLAPFDFAAGIVRSRALLTGLEGGDDRIARAKGDTARAYHSAAAATNVPFRLYVPTTWDGKAHLPLVVFLHGANADENNALDRGNGVLAKLAEARGVILVAPLGYRINSSYGAVLPRDPGGFGAIADNDARRAALSEADVLAVTDLVAQEYATDKSRTYLMGNSMGGMGSWYLGAKYPARWAAVSPAAGGVNVADFAYDRLRAMPLRAVTGDLDIAKTSVTTTVAAARAAGLAPDFVVVPGGTHGSSVEIAAPATFDFFAAHSRP